ncbi:MAG: hypothetical protein QGH15_23710, partial [Kiritimatiellia bacterium]|nr:hypothetical protein [Kiritimatiellia bacterium]
MNHNSGVSRRTFLSTSAVAATAGLARTGLAAEKREGPGGEGRTPGNLLASTYKSYSGHDVTSDAVH